MERKIGTVSRGVRCPIIREGDNLPEIVVNSVLEAAASEGFALRDRDVIAVTESVVARSQGNYATIEDIENRINNIKMPDMKPLQDEIKTLKKQIRILLDKEE